jgi:hypothetical protein
MRQSFGLLVGDHVQLSLRQKIIADKYIDFYELLPESVTSEKHLVLTTTKTGDNIKFMKESRIKYITLPQWNEAFSSYMSIYHSKASTVVESHNLLKEMLSYQRDINSLARQDLPWWKYDVQFRRDRSVDPSRYTFAHLRHDLIANLRYIPRTKQPFRTNNRADDRYHQGTQAYQGTQNNYSAQRNTQNVQRTPPGFCYMYHSRFGKCKSPPGTCKFKHTCPNCHAKHELHLCPTS